MDINKYYSNLETALRNILNEINIVESKGTDEYETTNYYKVLDDLYNAFSAIKQLLIIHKLRGFSKEEYIAAENKKAGDMIIEHVVKDYETTTMIANIYGVEVSEILQVNNLTSYEIVTGTVLKIRISTTKIIENSEKDVPVFGSRIGLKILGTDLYNELVENNINDLKTMDNPIDTLIQGIKNRITTISGDYPHENDFGIDIVGKELPSDLSEGLMAIEIGQQLEKDTRVDKIENITVNRSFENYSLDILLKTIKGKESISITV